MPTYAKSEHKEGGWGDPAVLFRASYLLSLSKRRVRWQTVHSD